MWSLVSYPALSLSLHISHDGARLYLEELFDEAGENTDIIYDWLLHPSVDLKTINQLSVVVGRRREHSEVAPLTTKPKIDII